MVCARVCCVHMHVCIVLCACVCCVHVHVCIVLCACVCCVHVLVTLSSLGSPVTVERKHTSNSS